MTSTCDALVVGAGGFVGGQLVRSLLLQGLQVRAVDVRPLESWRGRHRGADNRRADLSVVQNAVAVTSGATTVYDLASAPHDAAAVDRVTGVLTDTHLLLAARDTGVDRFVSASSAAPAGSALDDRRWRHQFTERMARHFVEDFGLQTRVARLGPVYGGHAEADGPTVVAIVCRRVAVAVATQQGVVEIPFVADAPASQVYVDDAVLGLQLIAHGTDSCGPWAVVDPAPLTVAEVVDAVLAVSGARLEVRFTGERATPAVVGDCSALAAAVDWTPDITLRATVEQYWADTSVDVRRGLDLPPSVADHWARRRAAAASARDRQIGRDAAAGRHRYENAG